MTPINLSSLNIGNAPTDSVDTKKYLLRRLNHTSDFILQIDNTSLETFTTCPRAAEYRLLEGRVRSSASPLTFGSAVHEGLEVWYKSQSSDLSDTERLSMALSAAVKVFSNIQLSLSEWRTPDRACDTIQRYIKRYPTEPFQLHSFYGEPAVEIPFSLPLCVLDYNADVPSGAMSWDDLTGPGSGNFVSKIHVYWTGKIDLAIVENGRNFILDHKTTSMVGPTFWDQFHLSNQTIGYCWAAEQIFEGMKFSGLIVNAIIGRPITKTGVHTDFERNKFYYSADQLKEWELNTKELVADFLANLHRGHFPMHTTWCIGKYGKCRYHDVCSLPSEARIHMLMSDHYADNTWSPLNKLETVE